MIINENVSDCQQMEMPKKHHKQGKGDKHVAFKQQIVTQKHIKKWGEIERCIKKGSKAGKER